MIWIRITRTGLLISMNGLNDVPYSIVKSALFDELESEDRPPIRVSRMDGVSRQEALLVLERHRKLLAVLVLAGHDTQRDD
ncbi:MAG: hypothetical protein Q4B32_08500 [Clostridia bacterium]|nr:hypothetical protein [Clostridia bacterium]